VTVNWTICALHQYELIMSISATASFYNCILLSGGVNSSFIASIHRKKKELTAFTVDFALGKNRDRYYAEYIVRRCKIGNHIVITPTADELEEAIEWVIKEYRTIDPLEIAQDAVHYIVLKAAKEHGCNAVLTGDGGDEMFAGNPSLFSLSDGKIRKWLLRNAKKARLPTVEIGNKLGVPVVTPLYSNIAKIVAVYAPIYCFVDKQKKVDRLMLRNHLEIFDLIAVARRRKVPVYEGSGAFLAIKKLSNKYRKKELLKGLKRYIGFRPKSKVQAYLAHKMKELRVKPPPLCWDEHIRCPVCGRCVRKGFCKFCGAHVTKNGEAVYPFK